MALVAVLLVLLEVSQIPRDLFVPLFLAIVMVGALTELVSHLLWQAESRLSGSDDWVEPAESWAALVEARISSGLRADSLMEDEQFEDTAKWFHKTALGSFE